MISTAKSLTTDGVILDQGSSKYQCLNCGLLFNPVGYSLDHYKRSSGTSPWDTQRHKNVAQGIAQLIHRYLPKQNDLKILEVGGGNYQTSYQLTKHRPDCTFTCLEPFPETDQKPEGINCINAFLSQYTPEKPFDLIFSNQVIEHIESPWEFLQSVTEKLADDGIAIICCPSQSVIRIETLFVDHLYHFSEQSFKQMTHNSGGHLIDAFVSPWDLATHCYIINKKLSVKQKRISDALTIHSALAMRKALIKTWSDMDRVLTQKIENWQTEPMLFGAGEFSQFLLCYAPSVFARVSKMIATTKEGAREYPVPIHLLEEIEPNTAPLILGVRDEIKQHVIDMLTNEGWDRQYLIEVT